MCIKLADSTAFYAARLNGRLFTVNSMEKMKSELATARLKMAVDNLLIVPMHHHHPDHTLQSAAPHGVPRHGPHVDVDDLKPGVGV